MACRWRLSTADASPDRTRTFSAQVGRRRCVFSSGWAAASRTWSPQPRRSKRPAWRRLLASGRGVPRRDGVSGPEDRPLASAVPDPGRLALLRPLGEEEAAYLPIDSLRVLTNSLTWSGPPPGVRYWGYGDTGHERGGSRRAESRPSCRGRGRCVRSLRQTACDRARPARFPSLPRLPRRRRRRPFRRSLLRPITTPWTRRSKPGARSARCLSRRGFSAGRSSSRR